MNSPLPVILVLGCCAAARVADAGTPNPTGQWPHVVPLVRTFHLVDHRQTAARVTIVGPGGVKLYLLECYLNAFDRKDPSFDYSGEFECRLTSVVPESNDGYSTLLTDEKNPTRDWQSRGRFLLQEMTGRCASYPEWGAVRRFRLRGMALTLEVSNVRTEVGSRAANQPWGIDRIKSLDLSLKVVPDNRALSVVAEPTEYAEPPYAHPENPKDLSRNCAVVLKRNGHS